MCLQINFSSVAGNAVVQTMTNSFTPLLAFVLVLFLVHLFQYLPVIFFFCKIVKMTLIKSGDPAHMITSS